MTHRENRPRLEEYVYKESIWTQGRSSLEFFTHKWSHTCTFLPSLAALLPIFLQQRSGSTVDARVLALHLVSKFRIEILQFCSES